MTGFTPFPKGVKPSTGAEMMEELKKSLNDKEMSPINILSRAGGFFVHVVRRYSFFPSAFFSPCSAFLTAPRLPAVTHC